MNLLDSTIFFETPLSHINDESAGNLHPNTPTGYEPKVLATKELATIPMSPDVHQLYEFGEHRGKTKTTEKDMNWVEWRLTWGPVAHTPRPYQTQRKKKKRKRREG